MRSYPKTAALAAAALATTLAGAACSSSQQTPEPATSTTSATSTTGPPPESGPAQVGTSGVSPDGVTTTVDAPSEATEDQYGQACLAAKSWMDGQGGDPKSLVEPYLKTVQAPDVTDPGNFNTPWAQLTPGQRAGVIMAANAAANGECS